MNNNDSAEKFEFEEKKMEVESVLNPIFTKSYQSASVEEISDGDYDSDEMPDLAECDDMPGLSSMDGADDMPSLEEIDGDDMPALDSGDDMPALEEVDGDDLPPLDSGDDMPALDSGDDMPPLDDFQGMSLEDPVRVNEVD